MTISLQIPIVSWLRDSDGDEEEDVGVNGEYNLIMQYLIQKLRRLQKLQRRQRLQRLQRGRTKMATWTAHHQI